MCMQLRGLQTTIVFLFLLLCQMAGRLYYIVGALSSVLFIQASCVSHRVCNLII